VKGGAGRGFALAVALGCALAARDVRADPPEMAPGTGGGAHVSLAAAPVFGTEAACGEGWMELVARVDNPGALPAKGTVEVQSAYGGYYASYESRFVSRVPFNVGPHAAAVLHVPVRGQALASTASVTARAGDGTKLAETTVSMGTSAAPLLVDVDDPSRLSVVMRGWPLSTAWRPVSSSIGATTALTVGAPATDPTTGDPVLPERAAGYAAATVVVIPSDRLARLQGSELDALVGWVLDGGTLAVFPTRPEDLRAGILTTLVGAAVTATPPPPIMMTLPGAVRSGSAPSFGGPFPSPPMPFAPPTIPPPSTGATPIGWYVPARTTPFGPLAGTGPTTALRPKLSGYSGGNLRPTEYGATASYGLGQVHVLGFNPTSSPALEDPWMHGRMLDMVGDAWERHALLAFPQGEGGRSSNVYEVRRALDPNENFRPALGIAAILLVLYSILAGPLVFMRSYRRGRPLDPLVWVPVASAGCFALIVVIGLAGKGWSGRARHLALVEAGAGMSRGAVHRFRGFFASQTRAMRVRASEPGSVLDLVAADSRDQGDPVLRLDKDGTSLENLTSLPWQTVVVSEDGFTELGGGVAVREQADGSVVVANHTGHRLKNVVVWAPKADASWFANVDPGETVLSTSGRTVFVPSSRSTGTAGTRTVHEIDASRFQTLLGHAGEEMTVRWSAMSSASGSSTDWWPDDVPVVIGEIEGGEGVKTDATLRVESDTMLFRVVGEGGAT